MLDFNTHIQQDLSIIASSQGGNSSAPITSAADNTIQMTGSYENKTILNDELKRKIYERFPHLKEQNIDLETLSQETLSEYLRIVSTDEDSINMHSDDNEPIKKTETLNSQVNNNEPFNHAEYAELSKDEKLAKYYEELAKNIYMFDDTNSKKTLEQWNNLDVKAKETYLQQAKYFNKSASTQDDFKTPEMYDDYINGKMIELKIAHNADVSIREYMSWPEQQKQEAMHNYLFQFEGTDPIPPEIQYYLDNQLEKTKALYDFFDQEQFAHGNTFNGSGEGQDQIKSLCLMYVTEHKNESTWTENEKRLVELYNKGLDNLTENEKKEYNSLLNEVTEVIQLRANTQYYEKKLSKSITDANGNINHDTLKEVRSDIGKLSKELGLDTGTSPEKIKELINSLESKSALTKDDETRLEGLKKLFDLKKLNNYATMQEVLNKVTPEYRENALNTYEQFTRECPDFSTAISSADQATQMRKWIESKHPNATPEERAEIFCMLRLGQQIHQGDKAFPTSTSYIENCSGEEKRAIAEKNDHTNLCFNIHAINAFDEKSTEHIAQLTSGDEFLAGNLLVYADDNHYNSAQKVYSQSTNESVQIANMDRAYSCVDSKIQNDALCNIYENSMQSVKEMAAERLSEACQENQSYLIDLYSNNKGCNDAMINAGVMERYTNYQQAEVREYSNSVSGFTQDIHESIAIANSIRLSGPVAEQIRTDNLSFNTIADVFTALKNKDISINEFKDIMSKIPDSEFEKMMRPIISNNTIKPGMVKFLMTSRPELFMSLLGDLINMGKVNMILEVIGSNPQLLYKVVNQILLKGSASEKIAAAKYILKSPSLYPKELLQKAYEIADEFGYAFVIDKKDQHLQVAMRGKNMNQKI